MFKPNNLDFNDGLHGAYTEKPNQGEMLKIFKFRAEYTLDIFNLNSHEEAIRFLIAKLSRDIEVLQVHLGETRPEAPTNIDELIARLREFQKAGHTEVYAYKPYPSCDYELINVKLLEMEVDYEHRCDNPDKTLPDTIIVWDNE